MTCAKTLVPAQTRLCRAFVYDRFGPPQDVLRQVDRPLPDQKAGYVRVEMALAPINPSDLIPITGAYAHRISLPAVAGYEGVGHVVAVSQGHEQLMGKRVLPLRAGGTWQAFVDCAAIAAVEVPDTAPDVIAARAYINPLTAHTMLNLWPVHGKTVLFSGAGSTCADLLGQWALKQGARRVVGLYRSEVRRKRLTDLGIDPMPQTDIANILAVARQSDLVFDSVGGPLGSSILSALPSGSIFVGYGLLSGQPVVVPRTYRAQVQRFHLRDHLPSLASKCFANLFGDLWPEMGKADWPPVRVFDANHWQDAMHAADVPGAPKSILRFPGRGT